MSLNLNRAFKFLYWEGAFAMVFETWLGPTYLSGLAGELGVSVFWVSLIGSAAWVGAVGQLVGAWAFEHVPSYKRYTIGVASAARALWILPLFFAAFWTQQQWSRGVAFPTERWFMLTAVVACGAALFGASSAAAWNSWMRALVPMDFRGRFFGIRQTYVMFALIGANLLAVFCVGWRPGGSHGGYALLGAMGVIAAGLSTFLLSRVQDAVTPAEPVSKESFLNRLKEPLRDRRFRGVVIYGAAFTGAIQLASPYFSYYFIKDLHIPMSQIAAWSVLTNVGCLVSAGLWGRHLDRTGDSRPVLRVAGTCIALSPLFYIHPSVSWVRFIAPFDYLTNGMAWSGYTLALTTLLFNSIPQKRTALCFAIYAAAAGLAGAVCSLLGGLLADWLMPWGGFRSLWLIAACGRMIAIWGLYHLLMDRSAKAERGGLLADYA